MFFANDAFGNRIYTDKAEPGHSYFCPACGSALIQKLGSINAHHFAHKVKAECDPWYDGKMSPWHIEMQGHFAENNREIVIWNESHTEYHIADVILGASDKKYVIEFQHSAISQDEFILFTNKVL